MCVYVCVCIYIYIYIYIYASLIEKIIRYDRYVFSNKMNILKLIFNKNTEICLLILCPTLVKSSSFYLLR